LQAKTQALPSRHHWVVGRGPALRHSTSYRLDGEAQLSKHSHSPALPAFEITGAKTQPGRKLIGRAQDCFRRVTAFVPDQLVRRRRGEAVFRKEPLRS